MHMRPVCRCSIIPADVLDRLSHDKNLSEAERQHFRDMAASERSWRKVRAAQAPVNEAMRSLSAQTVVATKPAVTVFNCKNGTSLPGTAVSKPGTAADLTAKRAFDETSRCRALSAWKIWPKSPPFTCMDKGTGSTCSTVKTS